MLIGEGPLVLAVAPFLWGVWVHECFAVMVRRTPQRVRKGMPSVLGAASRMRMHWLSRLPHVPGLPFVGLALPLACCCATAPRALCRPSCLRPHSGPWMSLPTCSRATLSSPVRGSSPRLTSSRLQAGSRRCTDMRPAAPRRRMRPRSRALPCAQLLQRQPPWVAAAAAADPAGRESAGCSAPCSARTCGGQRWCCVCHARTRSRARGFAACAAAYGAA